MRTQGPDALPFFRSPMQAHLLALLLGQPERSWTLKELAETLDAPASSVHRELQRAEQAGVITRNATARPHQFRAATSDPLYEPLAELLRRSVGVEPQLRAVLARDDVDAAVIHGSWASGNRRPSSDIDVLVIGSADLRDLRRAVRPISEAVSRAIDLTVLSRQELQRLSKERSGFLRGVMDCHTPLIGSLDRIAGL